ncbi:HK97-gp10 family putative phage morphogenesis protein [Phyllobacterium lublinensis]|uniref:HK97-gp10 family putative phage morphogenesis protein n=1 Tax=Phyllobacterium lublinensis TaxID=2875708 RepID=UPI001CCA2723|nr:HK97-gp10 family putative phage morphogenesis protein [Phyllobacterium sp. 2063]MBZ9653544.1 HK97 gp10 family phage protein [Phyllobacterium sp. 2063]
MVDGVNALTAKLTKQIPDRLRKSAIAAMETGADELVAMMKTLVPVEKGELRDSIGWTFGKPPKGTRVIGQTDPNSGDPVITIFAGNDKSFYAAFQEFGTVNMQPNPFFFTSWRTLRRRIRARITREINKAIKSGSV